MVGHWEDRDDRFSLTLTSWQQHSGWEGMEGWKKESNKTETKSPRPTNVLRSSQSKDDASGGCKLKVEEGLCVLYGISHLKYD